MGCFFGRGLVGGSTDESASFLELLKNIQVATLSAMQLSVFSYCEAEEARVRVERARGRTLPLACSFDYQAIPSTESPGADLADGDELTVEPTEHPIANNELTLFVGAGAGESTLEFVRSSAALTDDEMSDVAPGRGSGHRHALRGPAGSRQWPRRTAWTSRIAGAHLSTGTHVLRRIVDRSAGHPRATGFARERAGRPRGSRRGRRRRAGTRGLRRGEVR